MRPVTRFAGLPVTIRGRLVLGCVAMCLIIALVGAYAVMSITRAGAVVEDTYDRPLMAINFARSASLSFSRMNSALIDEGVYRGDAEPDLDEFEDYLDDFQGDLDVVEERALTEKSRNLVGQVRQLTNMWIEDVGASATGGTQAQDLRSQAANIIEQLDIIVELQANAAYLEREAAVAAIDHSRRLNIGAALAAFVVSALIIMLLTRSIVRPLDMAGVAANQIAEGDFEADIPEGGKDETGALLRSMAVMQASIRDMVAREKALRTTAQIRLIDALQNAHEAVILVDPEGRVAHANVKVKDFFSELRDESLHGEYFAVLFRPDGSPVSTPKDTLKTENAYEGEMRLPDGRWLRADQSATSEGGAFYTWTDITEAKARETAYLEARDRAEMASKAKTNFMTAMTHELRTPLNAIIGFSGLLKDHGADSAETQKSYSALIHESGMNLLTIIENILEISGAQKSELQTETIMVTEIVEAASASSRAAMKDKSIRFEISGDGGIRAHADPRAVKRSISEIVSNATKFTEPGGDITISVSGAARNGVKIVIRDNGIGMKPENIPVALEPFQQLESGLTRQYQGCGLGLALAKQLIERSGGRLSLESAPGEGCCVTIWLPPERALDTDQRVA